MRRSAAVPPVRIRAANEAAVDPRGDYVLYWMIAFRRSRFSFALQRAVELANAHDKPLLVLEALRCDYRWASDRLHRFVLDGMHDTAAAFAKAGVRQLAYVERAPGAGRGLVEALAERAVAVVTDDFPAFGIPYWIARVAPALAVRCEAVDANGLLPIRDTERLFLTAASFRRHLQKALPRWLASPPDAEPLRALANAAKATVPRAVLRNPHWKMATPAELAPDAALEATLAIDHAVPPAPLRGGFRAAEQVLVRFLDERLDAYAEQRNEPAADGTSGLSPYLHFGHLSTFEILARLAQRERWSLDALGRPTGSREGWWGMSAAAEAFLDELVTWREVGLNFCVQRPRDYARYASLPAWARETLEAHAGDERDAQYTLRQLERAETEDEVWNAAQRQLLREGRIAGYLRMLWGKKILEWTPSPQRAAEVMIALNDRWALDGRDPNSYSGIFWVLGRYDRPWGPERPVFGKVRYMTSDSARRKLRLAPYLARYGREPARSPPPRVQGLEDHRIHGRNRHC